MTTIKTPALILLSLLACPAFASAEEHYLSCNFNGQNFTRPLRQGDSLLQTEDGDIQIGELATLHINATILQRPKYSNGYKYISFSANCGTDYEKPLYSGCSKENIGRKFVAVGPQSPEEAVMDETHMQVRVGSFKLSCDLH